MNKRITAFVCAVVCAIGLTGCGGTKEIDINSTAQQLMSADIFDENLMEVKAATTEKRLNLSSEDIESCVSYAGTKAVVDEIVIVKAVSADAAANVKKAFDEHIATQKKSYSSYRPDEVPKLDSAVELAEGNYVVLVVSKDGEKEEKIVKDCMK